MNKNLFTVSDLGEKALIERIIAKNRSCSSFTSIINIENDSAAIDDGALSDYSLSVGDDALSDYSLSVGDDALSDYSLYVGDDAALTDVLIDKDSCLVSSSDMLIQSSHFPSEMSYYQMGFKSVAVNVSDLIAMGAEPVGFLFNVAVSKDMLLDDFDRLVCGVIGACSNYNMPLIGGDTNEGSEIIISGTAIGKVEKDMALMKHGFEAGDLLCISGELGLAALGFEILSSRKTYEPPHELKSMADLAVFKALNVRPDYENGRILAAFKRDYNISATDITDGLASELYEILNADKKYSQFRDNKGYSKGIRIYEDKLPVEEEFKEISKALNKDYLDLFLHVGEDFELLFTIPKNLEKTLKEHMDFYTIGEITENNTVEMVLSNGKVKKISPKGYEHLTED